MSMNQINICSNLEVTEFVVTNPIAQCLLMQAELQSVYGDKGACYKEDCTLHETTQRALYWLLCLQEELTEIYDWIDKIYIDNTSLIEAQYEVVDSLHFFNNFLLVFGVDPEKLAEGTIDELRQKTGQTFICDELVLRRTIDAARESVSNILKLLPWKSWKTYTDLPSIQDFRNNPKFLQRCREVALDLFEINLVLNADCFRTTHLYYAKKKENDARQQRGY